MRNKMITRVAAAMLAAVAGTAWAAESRRPNVLFIMADDLNTALSELIHERFHVIRTQIAAFGILRICPNA